MIELHGLTPLQRQICDEIWSMDTQEQLMAWFNGLPRRLQTQALTMMHLMAIEAMEADGITDFADAQAVIDRVRGD